MRLKSGRMNLKSEVDELNDISGNWVGPESHFILLEERYHEPKICNRFSTLKFFESGAIAEIKGEVE
jgi:hypothetical protein